MTRGSAFSMADDLVAKGFTATVTAQPALGDELEFAQVSVRATHLDQGALAQLIDVGAQYGHVLYLDGPVIRFVSNFKTATLRVAGEVS